MICASIYGRLGADPKPVTTKSGKPMARASLAVDCTGYNADQQETEWFSILAFGRVAEDLLRCEKGTMVAVSGSVTRSRWTAKDGTEKTGWQITAADLHSARTARPSGAKSRGEPAEADHRRSPAPPHDDGDDIPW